MITGAKQQENVRFFPCIRRITHFTVTRKEHFSCLLLLWFPPSLGRKSILMQDEQNGSSPWEKPFTIYKYQSSDISHAVTPPGAESRNNEWQEEGEAALSAQSVLPARHCSRNPSRTGTAPWRPGQIWNHQHRSSRATNVGWAQPLRGHGCLCGTAGMVSLSQGTIKHQQDHGP